jgi:broad specificity phosphatase PhoE
MLNVHFIRHGESLANVGCVTAEPHSIPLTLKGRQQANALSRSFDRTPDLIISSPYQRALQTAEPTVARFPDAPFEIWPVQEIEMLATARRIGTTSHDRRPLIETYWAKGDPEYVDGAGAESYRAFIGRVREALARLEHFQEKQAEIAVFGHEQFMEAVLLEIADPLHEINNRAMQAFHDFHHAKPIANAEGFSISWNGRQWNRLREGGGFDAVAGTE